MQINAAQAFADLFAMLCLATITPHALFYRNWYGVITGLACAAYAHYNTGNAIYALLICVIVSGVFYLRALNREFNGKGNSLHIVEFIDWAIERINESRQAKQPARQLPIRSERRYTPPRSR
jgi:hypothetical protein